MLLNEIAQHRLFNQQIAETKFTTAAKMISWMCAIQAQEYSQTKWSLGLRLSNLKDNDIEKDFTNGKILRTHLLRPTWHFVTAKDIRWLLMLTGPRVTAANMHMYRKLELDAKIFNRCNNIIVNTLQGGRQLTRNMLNNEFKKYKITATDIRLSCIMMNAELQGIICSGAREGNQFTYALLEERVPATVVKNKDEALAELTKRYFRSRGPATIKDYSIWSGLTVSDCRNGIEMVRSYFVREKLNNEEYFFAPVALNKISHDMHLLPIYDEYIMGYKNRSAILEFKNSFKKAPVFHFDNMIIFEGQVIGTWRRTIHQKHIDLEYNFFKTLSKVEFALFKNASIAFERFTGLEVILKEVKKPSTLSRIGFSK